MGDESPIKKGVLQVNEMARHLSEEGGLESGRIYMVGMACLRGAMSERCPVW